MAGQAFISHSRRDLPWVQWVAHQAQALGMKPYLAEHDPQPGRHLSAKIEAALRSSDVVIVLYTTNSIDSTYVNQEIGFARAINKLIVPLVHPDVAHRSRALLDGIEYITFDFDDPTGAADLIGELQRIANRFQERELLEAQRRQLAQAALVAAAVLALVVLAQQVQSGAAA